MGFNPADPLRARGEIAPRRGGPPAGIGGFMTDRTQAAPASTEDHSLRIAGGRSREGTIPAVPMPADRGMTDGPRGSQADDIDAVWGKYKAEPTPALRNVLMEHYLPLV